MDFDGSAESSHRTKGLLRVTMACNERCPFCNVPVEDYLPNHTATDAEIAEQLDAFVEAGSQTLTLSGGEPTLRRARLLSVIAEARERGIPYVELQTNAVLIDEAYAEQLARAGLTSAFISLLSDVPELHDELAGLKGAFPKCLRGIDALLARGIRVTLNPVFAAVTAERVPDYVDFVAERLPEVLAISLSAVQPHGRAAHDLGLLPDYAVLKKAIPEGRRRARAHGIDILNPYCGVPLCVGWDDDLAHCVEAAEAEEGGWRPTPGLENVGNKRQGPVCHGCALRTRCGGAWHAYWDVRGGSGLEPPVRVFEPWGPVDEVAHQAVVRAPGGPTAATWEALAAVPAGVPTVWLHTDRIGKADAARILEGACTDLALVSDLSDREALAAVRRICKRAFEVPQQNQVRLWLGIEADSAAAAWEALVRAHRVGVYAARLLGDDPRWPRLVAAAREQLPGMFVDAG